MFYFENDVLKSDFLEGVEHYFTTRNFTPSPGERAGVRVKPMIMPEQTHSDHVEFVDERLEYPDTDGLIITKPNQTIRLKFADCTPLIFYNPKTNIGAISHAGWRGTAQKIGVKTVQKMCRGVNVNQSGMTLQNNSIKGAKDIIAIIGPAIGLCCYEVSDEVKEKLLATVQNSTGLYKDRNVDLKAINARQLQEIGVEKIDICPYCTSCDNDLFYSYRKENGTTNRHYAVLRLPG